MVKKNYCSVTGVGATLLVPAVVLHKLRSDKNTHVNVDPGASGFQILRITRLIHHSCALPRYRRLLVFVYLIWGGIEWITAGGEQE